MLRASAADALAKTPDGAVVVETTVGAEGFMAFSHTKATAAVVATDNLAQDLWGLVEAGDRVRQVAAAVGVPDASNCVYSLSERTGSSTSMGSAPPL